MLISPKHLRQGFQGLVVQSGEKQISFSVLGKIGV